MGGVCGGGDLSEPSALRPLVSYERRSWALRQEQELARVARGVTLGMRLISDLELDVWRKGLGLPFLDLVSQIKEPYPPVRHGHWSAVPDLWVCDVLLERELHQGVTPGCPGDEYMDALRAAWSDAGLVVQRMERVARMVHSVDAMSSRDYYQSSISSEFSYEVVDLSRNIARFDRSLARLRRVSREWDLSIVVHLGGGG